jgi:hypothetical protein
MGDSDLEGDPQPLTGLGQDQVHTIELRFRLRVEFASGAVRVDAIDPRSSEVTDLSSQEIVIDGLVGPYRKKEGRPVASDFRGSKRFQGSRGPVSIQKIRLKSHPHGVDGSPLRIVSRQPQVDRGPLVVTFVIPEGMK